MQEPKIVQLNESIETIFIMYLFDAFCCVCGGFWFFVQAGCRGGCVSPFGSFLSSPSWLRVWRVWPAEGDSIKWDKPEFFHQETLNTAYVHCFSQILRASVISSARCLKSFSVGLVFQLWKCSAGFSLISTLGEVGKWSNVPPLLHLSQSSSPWLHLPAFSIRRSRLEELVVCFQFCQ